MPPRKKTDTSIEENKEKSIDNDAKPRNKIETISNKIREEITAGKFKPYNVLPHIRDIAIRFETTSDTIRHVLKLLETEGHIYRGVGQIYRVSDGRERITYNEENFREYMRAQGRKVRSENLVTPGIIEASPRMAHLFRVPVGTHLVERARREIVDGAIVYRYSRKYYLASLLTAEEIEAMNQDTEFNVRAPIEQRNPLGRIEDILIARTIQGQEEAKIFKTTNRSLPILELWRLNYSFQHEILYISHVVMNGNFFEKRHDYQPGNEPKSTEFCQRKEVIVK